MKKTAAILMAAGMAAISLTGCLGSSAKPEKATAAQTTAKAEETDAKAETSGGESEAASKPAKDAVILKYSATCPPVGTQADGALKLGELIKEYSGGELVVEFYPSSQLGDKVETLAGLQNGTIEFTELAATDLSSYDDIWSVFSLPYMFDSGEQAVKVLSDPEVAAILEKSAEDSGFKIISWWNFGERSILNAKKPVTNPSDLKGLNIRCMENAVLAGTINAMGATGVPMAWSEVYTAVQQKTIDGLENSIPVITSNKLYEVAKYFSKTEQFIIPDPILMSKAVYDSLTPEQQQAIDEAGKQMDIEWNEKIWPAAMKTEVTVLTDAGVEINEVDKDSFKAAVQPVVDEFLKTADEASVALYETVNTVKAKY